MNKTYTLIIFMLAISMQINANVRTCTCSCIWASPSTWSGNQVPVCTDTIVICANHTNTINTQVNYSGCADPMYIYVNGQLNFATGNKLTLPAGSVITIGSGGSINPGNGGGNSNIITIGTVEIWNADMGSLYGNAVLQVTPLPIKLIGFDAKVVNGTVELNWKTASESSNDYFTIQKTLDGQNFEDVNIVDGAGESTTSLTYKSWDIRPYNGKSYYRLAQTDYDGKSSFSGLIDINVNENAPFSFDLFQNPGAGSNLMIEMVSQIGKEVQLTISDSKGSTVYSENIQTAQNGKFLNVFNLSKPLKPGFYTVFITSEENKSWRKYIVQ
jgi:hypothetical protein